MFKHMRFLNASVITETFIMFAMALMSYFVSTMTVILGLEMSGIISLLICGIVQAHYAWFNLSPQGKQTTSVTFQFLGMAAEAAVYSYIGISLYFTIPSWWSFEWILAQTIIVILGRIIGVICTFYFFTIFFMKRTISFNELMFITWGGMIRGAIAFALVMKIPYVGGPSCPDPHYCYTKEQYDLAVSTCLILVMVTTLFFGTFMKLF
jgi:NhaP-type Na+/H+ or K+/H+ antiporter